MLIWQLHFHFIFSTPYKMFNSTYLFKFLIVLFDWLYLTIALFRLDWVGWRTFWIWKCSILFRKKLGWRLSKKMVLGKILFNLSQLYVSLQNFKFHVGSQLLVRTLSELQVAWNVKFAYSIHTWALFYWIRLNCLLVAKATWNIAVLRFTGFMLGGHMF